MHGGNLLTITKYMGEHRKYQQCVSPLDNTNAPAHLRLSAKHAINAVVSLMLIKGAALLVRKTALSFPVDLARG